MIEYTHFQQRIPSKYKEEPQEKRRRGDWRDINIRRWMKMRGNAWAQKNHPEYFKRNMTI